MNVSSTIFSMTGFGSSEAEIAGLRYRAELKSINHRFQEIKMRLPRELNSFDFECKKKLSTLLGRGTFELKVERLSAGDTILTSPERIKTIWSNWSKLKLSLQSELHLPIQDEMTPYEFLRFLSEWDLIERKTNEDSSQKLECNQTLWQTQWKELSTLLDLTAHSLLQARKEEGLRLKTFIHDQIHSLEKLSQYLRGRRNELKLTISDKIKKRLETLFQSLPTQEDIIKNFIETRITQEMTLLLEKSDIEEELTRFEGHLKNFFSALNESGPVGKKLEFLLQELTRELNTLSTKSQDLSISESIVSAKVNLEQIREQVLNLE